MNSKDLMIMAVIVTVGLVIWLALHMDGPPRFRRRPVLTGNERDFYFRLEQALPECLVCPQVAVSALIEPAGVGRARQLALERIENQRVGYAVFDRDMELLAVIELDQRDRPKRRDAARDRWFASAGIRTIRFHVKKPPSTGRIKRAVFAPQDRLDPYVPVPSSRAGTAGGERRRNLAPWRNSMINL